MFSQALLPSCLPTCLPSRGASLRAVFSFCGVAILPLGARARRGPSGGARGPGVHAGLALAAVGGGEGEPRRGLPDAVSRSEAGSCRSQG